MPSQSSLDAKGVNACLVALEASVAPLTLPEIAGAAFGKKRSSAFNAALAAELSGLPANSGIYEWPKHGSSRVFSSRPMHAAVEEAFLAALAEQPLTASKAAKPVAQKLRRVSQATALKQVKAVAPGLLAAKRVFAFAVNRQLVVYFSFAWAERQIPRQEPSSPLEDTIMDAIRQLDDGRGNYLAVESLRQIPALRRILDNAILGLAEAGKLVMSRYDGPRPVPDEEKFRYIEATSGHLFIGVALPRSSAAST